MKLQKILPPSRDCSSNIGHDFSNKVVQKLKLSKKVFSQCAQK